MRYIKLTLGLILLGALLGFALGLVEAGDSSPDDIVYISPGEWITWLTISGVVLGTAIGLVASVLWALWRWLSRLYRRAPAL